MPATLETRPDQVVEQLRIAEDLGVALSEILPLRALAQFGDATRKWNAQKGTFPPTEFAEFLKESTGLARTVEQLDDEEIFLLEARYWALTNQQKRVRAVDERLAKFKDHRKAWFEAAYQCRIAGLARYPGKSEAETRNDAARAVTLLNNLLALPLERNLSLVKHRIILAQDFDDENFLHSIAWIIVTKLQRAPTSARPAFQGLLTSIFTPYLSRTDNNRVTIMRPSMKKLHADLCQELGISSVIPNMK